MWRCILIITTTNKGPLASRLARLNPIFLACKPGAVHAFLLQALLALLLFSDTWLPEQRLVFADKGDGLKNLFTLRAYLERMPDSPWAFDAMNHPHGESLWYTDATPLLALGFRQLRWMGVSAEWLAGPGFHLFLLLSMALSSGFLFALLRRLGVSAWLALLLALCWPWAGPQSLRLFIGHFNLSLSWVIPGLWLILLNWEESRKAWQRASWTLVLLLWLVMAGSLHLYYLPMLAMMLGVWMLVQAWINKKNGRGSLRKIALALVLPALAAGLLLGWIRLTDPFFDLRPAQAQGYNWTVWNLNPDGLWKAYAHLPLPSIPGYQGFMDIENHVYFGGFAIWTMVAGLLLVWQRRMEVPRPTWARALVISGLACLVLGLGEYVKSFGGTVNFDNWLHPFKWMRLLSDAPTQFRCLGRLAWPAFLGANIGAALLWERLWRQQGQWWGKWLMIALLVPLVTDTWGQIRLLRQHLAPDPFANTAWLAPLAGQIPPEAQAILPLPWYHVGSEDPQLTLDPTNAWEQKCLQAALALDLPLISSKMSRTPSIHAREVLEWLAGGTKPAALGKAPVLVMFSREESAWPGVPGEEFNLIRQSLLRSRELPASRGWQELASTGEVSWFLWAGE